MPEAKEQDHWGNPSFRVKGKIFATLRLDEKAAVLKLSQEEQDTFAEVEPAAFEKIAWGTQTWTRIHLSKVKKVLFRQLLISAWRRVAPKRVAALLPPSR